MRKQTVKEFLATGGCIVRLPYIKPEQKRVTARSKPGHEMSPGARRIRTKWAGEGG